MSQFTLHSLLVSLDLLHHESLITKHLFVAFFLAAVCKIKMFLFNCSYTDM